MDRHSAIAVIPARSASTRLPGKLLLRETGKSILQHTYETALGSRRCADVIIAAADQAIATEARSFGARCQLTDPDLPSGTDRVAAVAREICDKSIFVNVQGDEPELPPASIDALVEALQRNPHVPMATLATPIRDAASLYNPACVKVVFDGSGRALYFSRSPIPYDREQTGTLEVNGQPRYFQHIGLYAYRRDFLLQLADLPTSPLEELEKLEQLRVLQAGYAIQVIVAEHACEGIDTADDYQRFVLRMSA